MTPDEIRAILADALREVAPEADAVAIDPSVPLTDQIDFDSMDSLTFLTVVAERTGVDVPESDYGQVQTLDGCVAYVAAALE